MMLLRAFAAAAVFLSIWLWLVPFVVFRLEPKLPGSRIALVAGAVLFLAGAVLGLTCVVDFGRHGKGTPAPVAPPKRLVIAGPYRWVRNPMYLGAGMLLLGEAILLQSYEMLILVIILAVGIHAFIVRIEERTLAQKFGPDYTRYKAEVDRWVPKPPATGPSPSKASRP